MERRILIETESPRLTYGVVSLDNSRRLTIRGGITVIGGPNGSGKTTLANVLARGRYGFDNRMRFADGVEKVKMLSFNDVHSLAGIDAQYYAQRMESSMNDFVPTVAEVMGDKVADSRWGRLCDRLSLKDMVDKKVNFLSSGEVRKLLLISVLVENPQVLILDNPYIGLDASSRSEFDEVIAGLREDGMSVVMMVCDEADIPAYADEVVSLGNDHARGSYGKLILPAPCVNYRSDHKIAFAIRDGHLHYGERVIFRGFDWTVLRGECWALSGPNGSGKSLLLSMICADNPQSYSNDITVFDRRRGSGESIWEIKDSIGYVSPEMHLYFKSSLIVREIVLQGLRPAMRRYEPPTDEETETVDRWLDLLGISHLGDRRFGHLSSGQQRLTLLARAMAGQPPLLVLDEPFHGLDAVAKERVKRLIEMLAARGAAVIFVTHDLSDVPSCVTRYKTLCRVASTD